MLLLYIVMFPYTPSSKQPLLGTLPIDSPVVHRTFITPGQCLTIYEPTGENMNLTETVRSFWLRIALSALQHRFCSGKTTFPMLFSSQLSRSWAPGSQGAKGYLYHERAISAVHMLSHAVARSNKNGFEW